MLWDKQSGDPAPHQTALIPHTIVDTLRSCKSIRMIMINRVCVACNGRSQIYVFCVCRFLCKCRLVLSNITVCAWERERNEPRIRSFM